MPFIKSVLRVLPEGPVEEYLNEIPSIAGLEELSFTAPVTFFAGENGSGKSTLLEALAVLTGMNAEGGGINFNFSTRQSHSGLHHALRLRRSFQRPATTFFLRAESFYNLATNLDELRRVDPRAYAAYGGRSLHEQSHGESFLNLVVNRFSPGGLYLLDEPEAALSPSRQLSLLAAIHRLVQEGSQFIIATHSPILMAYPDAQILLFGEEGIRPVAYTDTEHYRITHDFLCDPQRMMRVLFEEG